MSDRHDIVLREASGPTPNPPSLISELKDLVHEIFPDVAESGVKWFRGRSEQEVAKAAEIRASALEKLGQLDNERQRLLQERDATLLKAQIEQKRDRMAHEQKMYELRTERLKAVVEALKVVKETGARLNARTLNKIGDTLISSLLLLYRVAIETQTA